MNPAVAAALLSGLFAAGWQAASSGQALNAQDTEKIERGELHSPGGDAISYRIRLLPVASFPDLPAAVAAQLRSRRCMVPQTFEAQAPENVIEGAFRAAGSSDWAVLCSVEGSTTLYVFLAGQFETPVALRSQPDTAWLGSEPGSSVFGSAWGISARSAANLRSSRQLHGNAVFDHDGIEDARLEHSATIRYDDNGRWLALGGPQ
jgi:hypothetical protein